MSSKTKTPPFATLQRSTRVALLAFILLFGFLVRIWNIDAVPAGIYPDEAQNGYDAFIAQSTGTYQWFYPDNNGREGFYINLIALSFKLFGVSILTFKLTSIIIGTLTILGTYLLGREIFWRWKNRDYLALISAFLIAGSFWHIMFSRIGFRAILLPLVLVFSFWLLLRGLRFIKERRSATASFFASGLVFGLGMHTYIAFRIAPGALIILFIALLFTRRFRFHALLKPAILFLAGTLISAAPILWTFYAHPEYLTSRSSDVSIFSPHNNGGDLIGTLGKTLGLSLAKFTFWGDQNWRHGYPPYPTLEPITGILFVIGIIGSLTISLRFFANKIMLLLRRSHDDTRTQQPTWPSVHLFLLAWFFLMLAPEFLTAEGLPHALRSIGTLPVVYLFATIGIGLLWRRFEGNTLIFREFFVPLLGIILLAIALFGTIKYHVFWAQQPQMAGAFNKNITDIARAIERAPRAMEKVAIAGPLERLPIKLLNTSTENLTILYEHEISTYTPSTQSYTIYMTDCPARITDALRARLGAITVMKHVAPLESHYCTVTSTKAH